MKTLRLNSALLFILIFVFQVNAALVLAAEGRVGSDALFKRWQEKKAAASLEGANVIRPDIVEKMQDVHVVFLTGLAGDYIKYLKYIIPYYGVAENVVRSDYKTTANTIRMPSRNSVAENAKALPKVLKEEYDRINKDRKKKKKLLVVTHSKAGDELDRYLHEAFQELYLDYEKDQKTSGETKSEGGFAARAVLLDPALEGSFLATEYDPNASYWDKIKYAAGYLLLGKKAYETALPDNARADLKIRHDQLNEALKDRENDYDEISRRSIYVRNCTEDHNIGIPEKLTRMFSVVKNFAESPNDGILQFKSQCHQDGFGTLFDLHDVSHTCLVMDKVRFDLANLLTKRPDEDRRAFWRGMFEIVWENHYPGRKEMKSKL